MTDAAAIASYLDELLATATVEDYSGAVNGLQFTNDIPITGVCAAVDFSVRAIRDCIDRKANLLIVHHGMFWNGSAPFTGTNYQRIKLLIENHVAVYSSHLPLDLHPEVGNNVLLARALGLTPSRGFAYSKGVAIGVAGDADVATSDLVERVIKFSEQYGASVVATSMKKGRQTRKWGMCTGSGAGSETLAEVREQGIDTLIVGEGPHWTAVAAEDDDISIIYAGHYATETLGVQAIAESVSKKFGVPWSFIQAPTGL
ncbi:MAG TPA: Nif3-like dinuclear metal center hexameric protein [Gemmatimonadaceae bacterium]|nr:Nif3-like dinuclear metal center hexameric protein [Gemmatimonadaceae bacterium]